MESEANRDYHARRADEERRMAEEASDPKIAALHWELAARYEELAGIKEQRAG